MPAPAPLTLGAPLMVQLETQTVALADLFALWPTLERADPCRLRFQASSMGDAVRMLNACSAMSAILR
jgi:D-amino peptidase